MFIQTLNPVKKWITPFWVESITVQNSLHSNPALGEYELHVGRRSRACDLLHVSKRSADVERTLSHSTTDLRVGRLSDYVDHKGCQTCRRRWEGRGERGGGREWDRGYRGRNTTATSNRVLFFFYPTYKKHRYTSTSSLSTVNHTASNYRGWTNVNNVNPI